jgi:type VI protein secretion system component VasF
MMEGTVWILKDAWDMQKAQNEMFTTRSWKIWKFKTEKRRRRRQNTRVCVCVCLCVFVLCVLTGFSWIKIGFSGRVLRIC